MPAAAAADIPVPAVIEEPVALSAGTLRLVADGLRALWSRIVAADPHADASPLLLGYDVHPTADGPVLIEVNTNAGGILAAIAAARETNDSCAAWEQAVLRGRLLELFRRDLLGAEPSRAGVVAVVDDELASQPLLPEMHALAAMMRADGANVQVIDAADLGFRDGRLRCGELAIDRVYWRSTDFLLEEERHAAVRRAVAEGTTIIAPSPQSYRAIADKRLFIEWSRRPELARDPDTGQRFRIAETVPLGSRTVDAWYADRGQWVFKPSSGYGSRGVYVGKSISRRKLAELPTDHYLAQRYHAHPLVERAGKPWKYDVRFFADRSQIIGAAARVFQGQVMGLRMPGSGFAPVRIGDSCCLTGALAEATLAGGHERDER